MHGRAPGSGALRGIKIRSSTAYDRTIEDPLKLQVSRRTQKPSIRSNLAINVRGTFRLERLFPGWLYFGGRDSEPDKVEIAHVYYRARPDVLFLVRRETCAQFVSPRELGWNFRENSHHRFPQLSRPRHRRTTRCLQEVWRFHDRVVRKNSIAPLRHSYTYFETQSTLSWVVRIDQSRAFDMFKILSTFPLCAGIQLVWKKPRRTTDLLGFPTFRRHR